MAINKSKIMIIISMIIFGTIALFVKNINLSSQEIALYRALFAFIIIFLFLLITKKLIPLKKLKKELPILAISGFLIAFGWILLFESYNYTTVSVATLAYYFAPVIVAITCAILFKEKMNKKNIICFSFATLGVIFVSGIFAKNYASNHFLGFTLALLAAILYASVIILNKKINHLDGINKTCYQFLFVIVVLIPYVLYTKGFNLDKLNHISWINLLIIGIIHTGITYCLYFTSIKNLKGSEIAILSYIDPFVAIILSVCILGENITIFQIIGAILIILFSLLNEINLKKKSIIK